MASNSAKLPDGYVLDPPAQQQQFWQSDPVAPNGSQQDGFWKADRLAPQQQLPQGFVLDKPAATLTPVDHDPFAQGTARLTPVDHDPFASAPLTVQGTAKAAATGVLKGAAAIHGLL